MPRTIFLFRLRFDSAKSLSYRNEKPNPNHDELYSSNIFIFSNVRFILSLKTLFPPTCRFKNLKVSKNIEATKMPRNFSNERAEQSGDNATPSAGSGRRRWHQTEEDDADRAGASDIRWAGLGWAPPPAASRPPPSHQQVRRGTSPNPRRGYHQPRRPASSGRSPSQRGGRSARLSPDRQERSADYGFHDQRRQSQSPSRSSRPTTPPTPRVRSSVRALQHRPASPDRMDTSDGGATTRQNFHGEGADARRHR